MPRTKTLRTQLPRFSDRLALGKRGLAVSPFCLGLVEDPATISAAFDAGINFFFLTADMHWPLYEASRRGLRSSARDQCNPGPVVVAGRLLPHAAGVLLRSFE